MYYGLKRCEQYKISCLMNVGGKCVGLNNTDFDYFCPFYKNRFDMSTAEIETYDDGCMNGFKPKEKGMVEVIKDICNSGSPRMHRRIVLTCDECGTNVRELYRHNGEEKCMDCLMQDLMDDGTIEYVSIPE